MSAEGIATRKEKQPAGPNPRGESGGPQAPLQVNLLDRYGQISGPDISHLSPEEWLFARLKQQGVDPYAAPGPFETLRERLAFAIVSNRFGLIVAGSRAGKPETYEAVFERIYETKLKDVVQRIERVRRGATP